MMKVCSIDGCSKEVKCRGMCNSHYQKSCKERMIARAKPCKIVNCGYKSVSAGFCAKHYQEDKEQRRGLICKVEGCGLYVRIVKRMLCNKHNTLFVRTGSTFTARPVKNMPSHRESQRLFKKGLKKCTICGEVKSLKKDFYTDSSKNYGGASHYSPQCRACRLTIQHIKWHSDKEYHRSRQKEARERNKEHYHEYRKEYYDKKVSAVEKKKTLMKNEVLKENTKKLKIVWNGIGRWSREYDHCENCQTTLYEYAAKGLCKHCWQKLSREANAEEHRRNLREYRKKNKEKYLQKQTQYRSMKEKIWKKALNREIPVTPKMENIINS